MIATLILTASFLSGWSLLAQLNLSNDYTQQTRINCFLLDKLSETERSKAFFPETWNLEGVTIERTVNPYAPGNQVVRVSIRAFKGEEIMEEIQALFFVPRDRQSDE